MSMTRFLKLKSCLVLCALGALTFACEDDESEGGSAAPVTGDPLSYEDFLAALVTPVCETLSGCCELDAGGTENCTMMLSADLTSSYSSENYDEVLGGRCAAELANAPAPTCTSLVSGSDLESTLMVMAPACDELLPLIQVEGDKQPGEECEGDSECAAIEGATTRCTGICEAEFRATEGDECNFTCEEDGISTSCSGSGDGEEGFKRSCYRNDGLVCGMSGTCEALLEEGEACEQLFTSPCVEGFRCAEGVCAPQLPAGETCSSGSDCASGFCESDEWVCADLIAEGEMCQEEIPCASSFCATDTNQCISAEEGALGFFCAFLRIGG